MEEFNIEFNNKKKDELIQTIDKQIRSNRKNKALLSLKYDDISNKINFVQVSVIVISTGITFLETLKSKYTVDEDCRDIITYCIFNLYCFSSCDYKIF